MQLNKIESPMDLFNYIENLGYNEKKSAKDNFIEFLVDNPECIEVIKDFIEDNFDEGDNTVEFENDE